MTHDLNAAKTIANEKAVVNSEGNVEFVSVKDSDDQKTRFIILKGGGILKEGSFEDLEASDHEYIREFLD